MYPKNIFARISYGFIASLSLVLFGCTTTDVTSMAEALSENIALTETQTLQQTFQPTTVMFPNPEAAPLRLKGAGGLASLITYHDPASLFAIDIPNNWAVSLDQGFLGAVSPDEMATVIVFAISNELYGVTNATLANQGQTSLSEFFAEMDAAITILETDAGEGYSYYGFSAYINGQTMTGSFTIILYQNVLHQIMFLVNEPQEGQYNPILEKVAESYQFTPGQQATTGNQTVSSSTTTQSETTTFQPATAPFTAVLGSRSYENWGRPSDGCAGPYNDRSPVKRFTVEVLFTNHSNQTLAKNWFPEIVTAKRGSVRTCYWNYDGLSVAPGQTINVTFVGHVEADDWVAGLIFRNQTYQQFACLTASGADVPCP